MFVKRIIKVNIINNCVYHFIIGYNNLFKNKNIII